MENLQENWLDRIGLQHFAETPVEGPAEELISGTDLDEAAISDIVVTEEQPAFFEYDSPDGEKMSFKDAEALKEAFGKSFMRQKDYTGKTTALSQESERVKAREKELEKQAEDLKGIGSQYKKFKAFMEARPDAYRKFKQMVESPPSPEEAFNRSQSYTDGQLKEIKGMLDEMKQYRADQEFNTQKQAIYNELKGKYPDFDSGTVEKVLGGLTDDPKALLELAYFSQRGRQDPVEMERRLAEAQEKKRQQTTGVITGSGKPVKGKDFNGDIDDARRAAHEEV